MEFYFQFLVVTLALACSMTLIGISFRRKRKAPGGYKEAPAPAGGWPIIGHLHMLTGRGNLLHRTLGRMSDENGPIFRIRMGSHSAIVVSSSEIAKECFATNDKVLSSRPTMAATRHMCYNNVLFGFAPYTSHWRKMRKIVVQELLSNRRLALVNGVSHSELIRWMKKVHGMLGEQPVLVNLHDMLYELSVNVMIRVTSGKIPDLCRPDEVRTWREIVSSFFRLIGLFLISDAVPWLWWLDEHLTIKEMKKTGNDIDRILAGWLKEHREREPNDDNKTEDFMDVMLSLEKEGELSGFNVDEETSIKSTCLGMMAGGSDTIPTTIVWALSLLLNNEHALKKAREEIDNHVGFDRQVDVSDICKLVYVEAVVKETLRLYPAGPLTPREAMEDCTIAGYNVAAGTRLIINTWKIHRDPEKWTDPDVFMPERFVTNAEDFNQKVNRNYELAPFGGGRRSCPGAAFAQHSVQLTLATLLHAFDFRVPSGGAVDLSEKAGMVMEKAHPLEVLLSPRIAARLYC